MGKNPRKYEDINDKRSRIVLRNYKCEAPYNIRFIGNLEYQYSYDCIDEQNKTEFDALKYHLDWVQLNSYIKRIYNNKNNVNFRRMVNASLSKEEIAKLEEPSVIDPVEIISGITNYYKFEYYRLSSMAKAIHRKNILPVFMAEQLDEFEIQMEHKTQSSYNNKKNEMLPCECKKCSAIRKSEHMRWCAYMRSIGYRFANDRNDRAKLHHDLKAWDKLKYLEKFKD